MSKIIWTAKAIGLLLGMWICYNMAIFAFVGFDLQGNKNVRYISWLHFPFQTIRPNN